MDAKTAAAACGITPATFQIWLQRGLVPGVGLGRQGRKRDFTIDEVTSIGMLAALTRAGLSASVAGEIVGRRGDWPLVMVDFAPSLNATIEAGNLTERQRTRALSAAGPFYGGFRDWAELPAIMAEHRDAGVAPAVSIIVDVGEIRRNMMRVERDYQLRQQRSGAAAPVDDQQLVLVT